MILLTTRVTRFQCKSCPSAWVAGPQAGALTQIAATIHLMKQLGLAGPLIWSLEVP